MSDKLNYIVEIKDDYLYVKYSGSLTQNDADSLYKNYQNILKNLDFDLKMILDCREFEECPPSLVNYSIKLNKILNDHGLICKALVAKSDIYKRIFNQLDTEFAKQKVEVFENIHDAEEWIKSF